MLNVSCNRLYTLPDKLPSSLKKLICNGNVLVSLPETLPDSLEYIEAGYNRLQTLPTKLPASLKQYGFRCDDNYLVDKQKIVSDRFSLCTRQYHPYYLGSGLHPMAYLIGEPKDIILKFQNF